MSATDELRRMLDERGVEWEDMSIFPLTCTSWLDHDGEPCTALEGTDDIPDGKLSVQSILTPVQAIAATLGPKTCQLKRARWDDGTCTWGCICSACDAHLEHETGIGYNYCPICGAKVVDE